ncbi:MAG: BrnA antitoxin family protein [Bryobacteraceae bacterium]
MKRLTKAQADEIRNLSRMKEKEIDLSDIPEVSDWSRAVVGKFYRPIKTPVTLRLDADVLAWLKQQGRGYQTRINNVLRGEMERASPHKMRSRKK